MMRAARCSPALAGILILVSALLGLPSLGNPSSQAATTAGTGRVESNRDSASLDGPYLVPHPHGSAPSETITAEALFWKHYFFVCTFVS